MERMDNAPGRPYADFPRRVRPAPCRYSLPALFLPDSFPVIFDLPEQVGTSTPARSTITSPAASGAAAPAGFHTCSRRRPERS